MVGVELGPVDIVFDGDPSPPKKRAQQPAIFGPCLLWSNVWNGSRCYLVRW